MSKRGWVWLGACWTLPNTVLGGLLALACRLGGARLAWRDGVLEVSGGHLARWLFSRGSTEALTLGQVVLAGSAWRLARWRRHERVHVGQYLRWGPLFLPAYALCSLWQALRGRRPYRDNPFERQAYAAPPAARQRRG